MAQINGTDQCHRSMAQINGTDQWHRSMAQINGADQWRRSMAQINGTDQWHRSMAQILTAGSDEQSTQGSPRGHNHLQQPSAIAARHVESDPSTLAPLLFFHLSPSPPPSLPSLDPFLPQLQFLREEGRQHSGTVGRRPIRAQGGGGMGRGGGGGEVGGVEGWEGRAMEVLLSLVEERIEHLMDARQGRAMELLLSLVEERIEHMMDARQDVKESASRVEESRLVTAMQIIDCHLAVLRSVAAWLRPRASGGGLESVFANPEARQGWNSFR
ncbi:unnamed protein product [Closterium sp. NIES-53]